MTLASIRSSFGTIVIVSCLAAAGMFEFDVVRGLWPDAAIRIAVQQLLGGIIVISAGGWLCSPRLRDTSPAKPAIHVMTGKWALAAGAALIVSALAGWSYLVAVN